MSVIFICQGCHVVFLAFLIYIKNRNTFLKFTIIYGVWLLKLSANPSGCVVDFGRVLLWTLAAHPVIQEAHTKNKGTFARIYTFIEGDGFTVEKIYLQSRYAENLASKNAQIKGLDILILFEIKSRKIAYFYRDHYP